jgi:ATP-dependent Clp protease adapter protein ClpS
MCTLALSVPTTAFTTAPLRQPQRTPQLPPLFASSDKGGGSAIAVPKTKQTTTTVIKQKQKSKQKKKFKPSEPDLRSDEDFEDAPMFRLYLIGDEADQQTHVINRMCEVVEDCSEDDAATLFKSATQTGEAFMGKYPREIAELYCEQLTRSDPIVYADVRDNEGK